MATPIRSLPPPLLSSRCHCGYGYKQMPLRLQADATATKSRCHCGYKQMPLRLHTGNKTAERPNKRYTATTNRCHCGYIQYTKQQTDLTNDITHAPLVHIVTASLFMCTCSPFVDIGVLYEYSPIVDLANSSTVVSAPESKPALFWPAPP